MRGRFFYPSYAGAHHSARRIQRERIDPRPAHPGSVVRACSPGRAINSGGGLRCGLPTAALEWLLHAASTGRCRVGLRARTVQGNTGPPRRGRCPEKEQRPLLHRCGYSQGGSNIEDRERTAHSPTRRADPPLERGVRPGSRISKETGALSDGACLCIGITLRDGWHSD